MSKRMGVEVMGVAERQMTEDPKSRTGYVWADTNEPVPPYTVIVRHGRDLFGEVEV